MHNNFYFVWLVEFCVLVGFCCPFWLCKLSQVPLALVDNAASSSCLPCFVFFSVSSSGKPLVHYIFFGIERVGGFLVLAVSGVAGWLCKLSQVTVAGWLIGVVLMWVFGLSARLSSMS